MHVLGMLLRARQCAVFNDLPRQSQSEYESTPKSIAKCKKILTRCNILQIVCLSVFLILQMFILHYVMLLD